MPHLYLQGQPIRYENGEVADILIRKGWKQLPIRPTPSSEWIGDRWVTPEPKAEQPNYLAFWDAVLVSQAYAALLSHAMVNLPTNTALTAFIAAFQDAKEGRPNPGAIQACISLVMGAAADALQPEHLEELQRLMDTFHLSSIYALAAPGKT